MSDRYNAILRANEVARTGCNSADVFQGLCVILREVVPYDRAGLSVYDPQIDGLKIVHLYGPHEGTVFRVGHFLDRRASQTGWVFDNKTALLRPDLERDLRFATDKAILIEGYRSVCSVPLVVRGNSIAVLSVLAAKRDQLSLGHAELVQEISNQIALAITSPVPSCPVHPNTRVICPKCIGAAGGKSTVTKHRDALARWGRKGGRGRKSPNFD